MAPVGCQSQWVEALKPNRDREWPSGLLFTLTPFPFHWYPTMTISKKSTKVEILAAYEALAAEQQSRYLTWPLVANTARLVADESTALVRDLYRLGAWCRKGFQLVVDTYSQPVLKKS